MRNLPGSPHMSLEEIAAEMNMPPGAVHTCIYRALRKLRSQGIVLQMKELAHDLDSNRKVQHET